MVLFPSLPNSEHQCKMSIYVSSALAFPIFLFPKDGRVKPWYSMFSGVQTLPSQVDGTRPKPTTIRVLLPHEILDSLADYPGVFCDLMLGNTESGARLKFWNHIRGLKPWASHPALDENNGVPLQDLIPLTIHGDGAEMYTDDEVFVWSIGKCVCWDWNGN